MASACAILVMLGHDFSPCTQIDGCAAGEEYRSCNDTAAGPSARPDLLGECVQCAVGKVNRCFMPKLRAGIRGLKLKPPVPNVPLESTD